MKRTLFIGLLLALFSSLSVAENEKLEPIHGIELAQQKIKIKVTSQGCTKNASFRLQFGSGQLKVLRIAPDRCRRLPHQIWLDFELPATQTQWVLTNPLTP